MSNGQVPRDDNDVPALGLWDSTGHQIVPAQAVSVATDSSGQKYGVMNVNASFSAASLAINDPTTTTQKAGVNAGGSLQVAGQGTAGTPAGGVVSIQGVASGTVVPVSGTFWQATQPVSGTVSVNALPTGANTVGNIGIVAGSAVIGSTTIQATSGTALGADQTNSELRVSNYVTKTTAGDTALTLGQALMVNSLPVAIASNQANIPIQIVDSGGTNKAAVDSNGNQAVKGGFTELASLSAGSLNADLMASTDVSNYKWLSLHITAAAVGTLNVQGSNDNSNFITIIGHSATTSGSNTLNVNGVNIFVFPIQTRYIRIRMTAYTSGTANGVVELYTSPVAADPASVALTLGGSSGTNIGSVSLIAASVNANGSNDSHLISAASTNATLVKASGGLVFGYEIYNSNAAARYVKLTNASSAPTPGTTAVFRTIGIPAGGTKNFHSTTGLSMGTGIGFYTCTGITDSDATAVALSDLSIDIDWK